MIKMNEITLTIRYKARSKPLTVSIQIDRDSAPIEEVARLFAEKLTMKYSEYLGGKKNMKQLRRYEFGQYKLLLSELERKYGQ